MSTNAGVIILCRADDVAGYSGWVVRDERGGLIRAASIYAIAANVAYQEATSAGCMMRRDLVESCQPFEAIASQLDAPRTGTTVFCRESRAPELKGFWRGFSVGFGGGMTFHETGLSQRWPLPSGFDDDRFGQERQIRFGWYAEDRIPGLIEEREARLVADAARAASDAAAKEIERRTSIMRWGIHSPYFSEMFAHLTSDEWTSVWQAQDFSTIFDRAA